jgi:NAD(P) transhydrogenase subunit alpha
MNIGIISEPENERRVALTPEVVKTLIAQKTRVLVEKDAGTSAWFGNDQYSEAGAEVVSRKEVFKDADLIVKINPLTEEEVKQLNKSQVVIAAMNPFTNKGLVESLVKSNVTSFSMELVPRISRAQAMDILSSMATVAGYKAVLDAAMRLPRFFPMFMSAAGTIKPAKILILGAGVAGLQAIAIGRKLGAVVEVFDVRSAVKEEVKSLGGRFVEVEGATEDASAGGYAVEQTEEFKQKQADLIHKHAMAADVIICTAQIPGRKAPVLIRKETVKGMKSGSVIIDLAASTGGNCELTQDEKVIDSNGVTIVGKSDYPSDMPTDASTMFAKNIANFIKLLIDDEGNLKLDFDDEIVKGTCLTHNGEIVNDRVKAAR